MDDILDRALNVAQLAGASYADARHEVSRTQFLQVKNRRVTALEERESAGLGVRVLVDGAWGFAATAEATLEEAERVTRQAVGIARASARFRHEAVVLAALVPTQARYQTPFVQDPFEVPLADKIALLVEASAIMEKEANIRVGMGRMNFWEDRKRFASSEGARIEQRIVHSGGGLVASAANPHDVQVRSYPDSHGGHFESAGYEMIERLDLVAHAAETAATAAALLDAPACPAGTTTVILDGTQMSLQIHESCGHPVELDRALGHEANFAGTSFLTPDQLGSLRYGSEVVNLVADATTPLGLGTFGFDDEGVPARKVDLVRAGRFVGYLTSRDTAASLGIESGGAMRAETWSCLPIIRMTNINLEPGSGRLDDLIAATDEGLLMATNRSWSIDDKRYNFQFGTEAGWEIKKGKRGRLLKNCTYTGITPEFWGSCDAVCGPEEWRIWGTPNCGKGQPMQIGRTGQGSAPARFRNVQVGVGSGS